VAKPYLPLNAARLKRAHTGQAHLRGQFVLCFFLFYTGLFGSVIFGFFWVLLFSAGFPAFYRSGFV
jgi:hypothetical protein